MNAAISFRFRIRIDENFCFIDFEIHDDFSALYDINCRVHTYLVLKMPGLWLLRADTLFAPSF